MVDNKEMTVTQLSSRVAARRLRSRDLFDRINVVELSSRPSGAYAGWLFAVLGASVTRYGPPLDMAAVQYSGH